MDEIGEQLVEFDSLKEVCEEFAYKLVSEGFCLAESAKPQSQRVLASLAFQLMVARSDLWIRIHQGRSTRRIALKKFCRKPPRFPPKSATPETIESLGIFEMNHQRWLEEMGIDVETGLIGGDIVPCECQHDEGYGEDLEKYREALYSYQDRFAGRRAYFAAAEAPTAEMVAKVMSDFGPISIRNLLPKLGKRKKARSWDERHASFAKAQDKELSTDPNFKMKKVRHYEISQRLASDEFADAHGFLKIFVSEGTVRNMLKS